MIHYHCTRVIDASPDAVWAVLGRFMHIDDFAPQIARVEALTYGPDRRCRERRLPGP